MNAHAIGNKKSKPLRDRIALIIYPPFMTILLVIMLVTIVVSGAVIYYTTAQAIEPGWLANLSPALELAGTLFNPAESDASRALDTLYVAVIGLVMGVFLRRCAIGANRIEVAAIILLLVLGGGQLLLILLLPTPAEAKLSMSAGDRLVKNLSMLLARNANIALAIFSASLGIQLNKEE